jgi:hypothetical protein
MARKKKQYKLVRIEMVVVAEAEELDNFEDDPGHYMERLLGGGAIGKQKNELIHGVVDAKIKASKNIPDVFDEYPLYDDGETYHSI